MWQASPKAIDAKARKDVCCSVANHLQLKPFEVQVESVKPAKLGSELTISIQTHEIKYSEKIKTLTPTLEVVTSLRITSKAGAKLLQIHLLRELGSLVKLVTL